MDGDYFRWIGKMLLIGFIAIIVSVGLLVYLGTRSFVDHNIVESKKILKPEIKLVITDNKVDTIYIYRK